MKNCEMRPGIQTSAKVKGGLATHFKNNIQWLYKHPSCTRTGEIRAAMESVGYSWKLGPTAQTLDFVLNDRPANVKKYPVAADGTTFLRKVSDLASCQTQRYFGPSGATHISSVAEPGQILLKASSIVGTGKTGLSSIIRVLNQELIDAGSKGTITPSVLLHALRQSSFLLQCRTRQDLGLTAKQTVGQYVPAQPVHRCPSADT